MRRVLGKGVIGAFSAGTSSSSSFMLLISRSSSRRSSLAVMTADGGRQAILPARRGEEEGGIPRLTQAFPGIGMLFQYRDSVMTFCY